MPRRTVPRPAVTSIGVAGMAFVVLLLSGCSWLRPPRGADGQAQTATATPPLVVDCADPVSGRAPCPAGTPPVSATALACSVNFARTSGGALRWRISARLTLAAGDLALADQPVQWLLPAGLVTVERFPGGQAPVTRTNRDGVTVLEVMDAGSTWLGRSLVQASFTDPPPHTGRSRILGPSTCRTGVPVPYPPPTPHP